MTTDRMTLSRRSCEIAPLRRAAARATVARARAARASPTARWCWRRSTRAGLCALDRRPAQRRHRGDGRRPATARLHGRTRLGRRRDRRVSGVRAEQSDIPPPTADLFVANSGTTMRFLTAMVALGHGRYRLDGVPRMRERPIEDLLDALAPARRRCAQRSTATAARR